MKHDKVSFVFLFVFFLTQKGKFVSYAKRVTPHKADSILLKILLKNEKVMKFEIVPTMQMSREEFQTKRKHFLEKAKRANKYGNLQCQVILLSPNWITQGGCHDNDSDVQQPMPRKLQAGLHTGQGPSIGL